MNGVHGGPTETTALLQQYRLPDVVLHTTNIGRLTDILARGDCLGPQDLSPELEAAYDLCYLSQLHKQLFQGKITQSSVWESWEHSTQTDIDAAQLTTLIEQTWHRFRHDYRANAEIEAALWTQFPCETGPLRVVDFLTSRSCPLVDDDIVCMSMLHVWKHGLSLDVSNHYDSFCIPRAIHALDLISHLSLIFCLLSLLIYPDVNFPGIREYAIFILSASIVTQPTSSFKTPAWITLGALTWTTFDGGPLPSTLPFILLLVSVVAMLFQLVSTSSPSPLLLISPAISMPLAVLIRTGISRICLPVLGLFGPLIAIITFALSMSLRETFFQLFSLANTIMDPSPIETRYTLLTASFILLFLAIPLSLFLLATSPNIYALSENPSWDRFSKGIGVEARRLFYETVIAYSKPSGVIFPTPSSLVHWLGIRLPATICRRAGWDVSFVVAERWLWRVLVGPFAAIYTGFTYITGT